MKILPIAKQKRLRLLVSLFLIRVFSRSSDGGFTWTNPVEIPRFNSWGTPDVDSNGTLFIGGVNLITGQIWCVRSVTAKDASVTPKFDLTTPVDLGGSIADQQPINPASLAG